MRNRALFFALAILLSITIVTGCRFLNVFNRGDSEASTESLVTLSGQVLLSSLISESFRPNMTSDPSAPEPGAEVWLEELPEIRDRADDEGNFLLENVPQGKYHIVASLMHGAKPHLGRSPVEAKPVEEQEDDFAVTVLEARNIVRGRLTDETGRPLPRGTELSLWGIPFTIDSDDGTFETPALPDLEGETAINDIVVRPRQPNAFKIPASFATPDGETANEIEAVVPSVPTAVLPPLVTLLGLSEGNAKPVVEIGETLDIIARITPETSIIATWTASAGELGVITTSNGRTQRTWTAPDKGVNPAVIFIRVENSQGQSASARIRIRVKGRFKVSFNSNGGTEVKSRTVTEDERISAPTVSKEGYNLVGWFEDAKFKNRWDFSKDRVTDSITLYAKWEKQSNKNNLKSIYLSVGELSPEFSKDVTQYLVNLPAETTEVKITANADSELATLKLNDESVNSISSTTIALTDCITDITITVVAEDLSEKEYEISFSRLQPGLNWSTTEFVESLNNDGSIATEIELSLTDDTFAINNGLLIGDTHYTTENIPAGLALQIEVIDSATATVSLTGNADAHTSANNIENLTITFLDEAFTLSEASNIANSSMNTLKIIFYDTPSEPEATLAQGNDAGTTKLENVTDAMEYSTNDGTDWASVPDTETEIDNIAVNIGDEILVRYKETDEQPASENQTLTVIAANIKPASIAFTALGDISGNPVSGETLSAGALTPDSATVDYQWQVSGNGIDGWVNIPGETNQSYEVDFAKTPAGEYVRVVATGNGNYTGTQSASAVQISNLQSSPNVGILKYIPAGMFQRDSDSSNISVITKPFLMGKYQITRKQFIDIMGGKNEIIFDKIFYWPNETDYNNLNYPDRPANSVSWYEAIAFCNKLSIAEGLIPVYSVTVDESEIDWASLHYSNIPSNTNADWNNVEANWDANGYRLPTEMEWMWAAMGADKDARPGAINSAGINITGYSKGYAGSQEADSQIDDLDSYAWYATNAGWDTGVCKVGEKNPNELGLHDISGNVAEWCWDKWSWIDKPAYPGGELTDYKGGDYTERVARGGSFNHGSGRMSISSRYADNPAWHFYEIGFRVVKRINSN